MTHEHHESLPGYSPEQIWHDGCAECEERGRRINISALDTLNFGRAIGRASRLEAKGLTDMSEAERPLLEVLAGVTQQVKRGAYFYAPPRQAENLPNQALNIVFDGPPGHEAPRFVETELDDGRGVKAGEWVERPDGYWALRITEWPRG